MVFGIADEEGSTLVTSKVTASSKIKKKDLRGIQGGYKAIASFGETLEYSIDGVLITSGVTTGFVLAALGATPASVTPANNPFAESATLYVESMTITEKNDDFERISVKLVGSTNLTQT